MSGDVRAVYAALGLELPAGGPNVAVACFADPGAHRNADRDASCSVDVSEHGAWRCHGCGEQGGLYDAALLLGRSPADAMALLKDHGFVESNGNGNVGRATAPAAKPKLRATEADVSRWQEALRAHSGVVGRLRELRGWTPEAIDRLGLGLDRDRVTFPVWDGAGLLVGVLRYQPDPGRRGDGEKKLFAVTGSRRELFPAVETVDGPEVWVVEGEPDSVALASMDIPAVGVPGAESWRDAWAVRFAGRRVVVCCDCDPAGRRLAERACRALAAHAAEVRRVDLDSTRDDAYDVSDVLDEHGPEKARALLLSRAQATDPYQPDQAPTAEEAAAELAEAKAELESRLGLPAVGLTIAETRIVGTGSRASADLDLSDGTRVTFERLSDFANPTRLAVEMVSTCGATPKIAKVPQALEAVALLLKIASKQAILSADDMAAELGVSFVQVAPIIDCNDDDQGERYAAWSMLKTRTPKFDAYEDKASLAAHMPILRRPNGDRLVRTLWFREFVRAHDPSWSAAELAHRMQRVGWVKPNPTKQGRIKATAPGGVSAPLSFTFYIVPAGWEDR